MGLYINWPQLSIDYNYQPSSFDQAVSESVCMYMYIHAPHSSIKAFRGDPAIPTTGNRPTDSRDTYRRP